MSIFGLFSGDKKYTTNQNMANTQDMRTAVGGDVGSLISPGAVVGTPGGGAVNAAPGSTVTQSVSYAGLSGDDVKELMANLDADHTQERTVVANLASTMSAGLRAANEQVTDVLAATKAPDSNAITQLLPLAVLLVIAWAITR